MRLIALTLLSLSVSLPSLNSAVADPFVPGTGTWLKDCSDDFEDPSWSYKLNLPKSSYEQDERQRGPGGYSNNRLWHEGGKRGTPDIVKRIDTPPDGLEGSTGALLMQTRLSGVPGELSGKQMQDDLLLKFDRKLGRSIPVSWKPSCTVRVYLPPFEQWENRSGPSFGMRADCRGRKPDGEAEPYWPGMFILHYKKSRKNPEEFAMISVRSNHRGQDARSLKFQAPCWLTMGMSFTPDGKIHYYAHEGVDELTEEDHLMSAYAYSWKCLTFNNFFFNVANWDNGRSWSTPWVIDDPKIYVQPPAGQTAENLYRRSRSRQVAQSGSSSSNRTAKRSSSTRQTSMGRTTSRRRPR